jgi:hypothetical protein
LTKEEDALADEFTHQQPHDPMRYLSKNVFCLPPPDELTVEQLCALHEFFHAVMVAGYRLYQVVPIDKASAIIREKFGGMAGFDARAGSSP